MKVSLAKSAGFCFGVKRALDIALETARSGEKVYMLGDIVHNEDVVKRIAQAGVIKITRLSDGKNKTLLIRAHGTGTKTFNDAVRAGYRIVDATCPMVKEIHGIARKMEAGGYTIIVIGDKRHEEVQGIIGQLKRKALVIADAAKIPFQAIKKVKKAGVVVQSTQNEEKALRIVDILKAHIPEILFHNTICKPTRIKQEEMRRMPLENDLMLVIGSKKSANTRRLYEISKSLNKRTYWINSEKQIRRAWLKGAKRVGVTAGASTPDSTTKKIINCLVF